MPLLEQREARFCSTHRPCGIELYPNHDSKGQRPSEHGRYDQEDGDKVEGDCAADRGKPYQEIKLKEWHYGRITGKQEVIQLACKSETRRLVPTSAVSPFTRTSPKIWYHGTH